MNNEELINYLQKWIKSILKLNEKYGDHINDRAMEKIDLNVFALQRCIEEIKKLEIVKKTLED